MEIIHKCKIEIITACLFDVFLSQLISYHMFFRNSFVRFCKIFQKSRFFRKVFVRLISL